MSTKLKALSAKLKAEMVEAEDALEVRVAVQTANVNAEARWR